MKEVGKDGKERMEERKKGKGLRMEEGEVEGFLFHLAAAETAFGGFFPSHSTP